MNYDTRQKIEQFAKDELDLGPYDEKTLRLVDFFNVTHDHLDDQYDIGYEAGREDGINEGIKNTKKKLIDTIISIVENA